MYSYSKGHSKREIRNGWLMAGFWVVFFIGLTGLANNYFLGECIKLGHTEQWCLNTL